MKNIISTRIPSSLLISKLKKPIFLFLLLIFTSPCIFSQTKVVSGEIIAFKDLKIKNVLVSAKKAQTSARTDSLGMFTIVCEKNDKLTFTASGFEKVTKSTRSLDTINLRMILKGDEESQQVAIGYGHVSKKDLLYSVAHFKNYNNSRANYKNIYDLIQAECTGVQIIGSGMGSRQVVIRGPSSINGSIEALYVVDGMIVNDISYLSPLEVDRIEILKDSSSSTYGSRGANGVVLITTQANSM